jgi:hypothetical protein
LDSEARAVYDDASRTPYSEELANFFDLYVHDSMAGFSADIEEPTGYWRYRKAFQGGDEVSFAFVGTDGGPRAA